MDFSRLKKILLKDIYITRLIIAMVVVVLFFVFTRGSSFLSFPNFISMALQFPEFGVLSLGVMLSIISGGIDLSIVSIANLSAIIAARIMQLAMGDSLFPGYSVIIILSAVVAALLVGSILGYINGNLISRVGVPPILATLGSMQLFMGISIVITKGRSISGLPLDYSDALTTLIFGFIPVTLIIFIFCTVGVGFLLRKTRYGLSTYMIGTNSTAAKFSGLNNRKIINTTYLLSGLLSAVAGLIFLANYNSAKADYGTAYTLQCVLIVILGGVSPSGGSGKIGGVIIAILLLQIVSSGLNMFQISIFYKSLVWGLVLLLMMIIHSFEEKKMKG